MTDPGPDEVFRQVMTIEPPDVASPFERASRDFVFGQVWPRPGLNRRDRRLVTLACVAAADAPKPIEDHVYAALSSGDLTLAELQEVVLQFAVYCGWPKASHLEGVIRAQWARILLERGEDVTPWPLLDGSTLGPDDAGERMAAGAQEFIDVNLLGAPSPDSPYMQAGILNYVFGHVWQRPGLSRRDRRIVTVECVAISDSPVPLLTHVGSALKSADISKPEMDEIVLQFSVYYGFAKGEALRASVDSGWAQAGSTGEGGA